MAEQSFHTNQKTSYQKKKKKKSTSNHFNAQLY